MLPSVTTALTALQILPDVKSLVPFAKWCTWQLFLWRQVWWRRQAHPCTVTLTYVSRYMCLSVAPPGAFWPFPCPVCFCLQKLWQSKCTARGANPTVNRALALRMAQAYMQETRGLRRVIALRTFLQTGCAGSFNALFSGDGYTYTGEAGWEQL